MACDGADVRTIEGFDDDPLMARLRQAFSAEHALQCGYCTPGTLVAARDLIRRKGGLSRAEIRTEMSGNLCRCTGYVGIVSAIEGVMAKRASLLSEPALTSYGWAPTRPQGRWPDSQARYSSRRSARGPIAHRFGLAGAADGAVHRGYRWRHRGSRRGHAHHAKLRAAAPT